MNTEVDDMVAQPQRPTPNLARCIAGHLQSKTLAGLMELAPLLITVFLIAFIVGHADSFVRPLPYIFGRPWDFPGIGLIAIIVIFYLVGLLISTAVGRRIMGWKSAALGHIPVIKTIFGATKQATTLMASDFNFSRVVFLEWPREGMVAMGFVTGRVYSESRDHSLAIVYIPTVPNPTSGNMAFINEDDLLETDITVEDAVKLIFSGGIVLPGKMAFARLPREVQEREFIGRFETHPE